MKRPLSILLIALIFVGFNSCKKAKEEVDEITEFDINYQTSITVPSNTLGINAPADYTTADVQTKSTENFTNNKTAANLVDKIVMTKFNVSVGTGNLDFLKSLSVYIKAQGLNETLVAQKTNIPTGISSLALDLQDVNIRDYIFMPNVQFRVTVTIDASTLAGQTLVMDETVHVKATVIK